MSFNNESIGRVVIDIETAPIDGAAAFLEEPTAPANYSKPEAIAKYIEKAKGDQLDRCSLDPDLCRIVAVGMLTEDKGEPQIVLAQTPTEEPALLSLVWWAIGERAMVGYNVLGFDALVLLRRSLYLKVEAPRLLVERFKHPRIIDLMEELSFGRVERRHSLDFYRKRFAVDVPDDGIDGADIPGLVARGEWEKVTAHVRADVLTTAALAVRLGHFQPRAVAEVA